MSSEEIEDCKTQLAEITQLLALDPDNSELIAIQTELANLLALLVPPESNSVEAPTVSEVVLSIGEETNVGKDEVGVERVNVDDGVKAEVPIEKEADVAITLGVNESSAPASLVNTGNNQPIEPKKEERNLDHIPVHLRSCTDPDTLEFYVPERFKPRLEDGEAVRNQKKGRISRMERDWRNWTEETRIAHSTDQWRRFQSSNARSLSTSWAATKRKPVAPPSGNVQNKLQRR